MFKILVLEDDKTLNYSVCYYLNAHGFTAIGCVHAKEAYDKLNENHFDLIISDIMLPDIDGFDFALTVRQINETVPIMFISARDDFISKKKGFLAGIDDYMVKPVDLDEMLLRINALLKRAKIADSKKLVIGNTVLDADAYTVTHNQTNLELTVREFQLLFKLLSYPTKTFTRGQFMEEFWPADTTSGTRTVDVYFAKIREKTACCEEFRIETVHGLGYKAVIVKQEDNA